MKILSPKQLQQADQKTIENENITSWELMERASLRAVEKLKELLPDNSTISILSGSGNNGGDGLAIAHHLDKIGYKVEVHLIEFAPNLSSDCSKNFDRLEANDSITICHYDKKAEASNIDYKEVIIDAIFGIGLNRDLPVFVRKIIEKANQAQALRIAIDVPSGLYLSDLTPENAVVFQAHHTLTFQCPKLNLFLPDYGNAVGEVSIIDIGLDQNFIASQDTSYIYVNQKLASSLLTVRQRFSHKGDYGHLLVIGGQLGMMGSVCLTSKAALKSGAGKVSVLTPMCGVDIIQQTVPEAMVIPSEENDNVTPVELSIMPTHICIGMGLGQSEAALQTLEFAIEKATSPMLIDADGINLISKKKDLLKALPTQSVLTPHQGELKRLIGEWSDQYDKLEKIKRFVDEYDLVLVSKDAYTFIACKERIYINSTGNAGLATAGSGDTLSGIISGLLAQNYNPVDASILGVYIHGKAADLYVDQFDENALIASTIIEYLGHAFSSLKPKNSSQ